MVDKRGKQVAIIFHLLRPIETLVAIMVVVAMTVTPGPILLLLFRSKFAEIAILIAVAFTRPGVIVGDLAIVPNVIIAVIGVVNAIGVMSTASRAHNGTCQRGGQEA
jgi:hypothetical protein